MANEQSDSNASSSGGLPGKDLVVRGAILLLAVGLLVIGGMVALQDIRKTMAFHNTVDACDRGDKDACLNLAKTYCRGRGVEEDDWKCQSILQENCADGHGVSCKHLGRNFIYWRGDNAVEHVDRALDACEEGDLRGCNVLGSIHLRTRDMPERAKAPVHYAERACRGGLTASCYQWLFWLQIDEEPDSRVLEAAEFGCEQGIEHHCLQLSAMTFDDPDRREKAARLLEQYCPTDDSRCLHLVEHLEQEDAEEATVLATHLCSRGQTKACGWLGEKLDDPRAGVPEADVDALKALDCQSLPDDECDVSAERAERHGERCSEQNEYSCSVYARYLAEHGEAWDWRTYQSALMSACDGGMLVACSTMLRNAAGSSKRQELRANVRQTLCESGYERWCSEPRRELFADYPTDPEPERIIEKLEAQCDAGDYSACDSLTGWYALTVRVWHPRPQPVLAEIYAVRGCELGVARSCSVAGMAAFEQVDAAYMWPDVLERQHERYERACNLGFALGCAQQGMIYVWGTHPRDVEKARRILDAQCHADRLDACAEIVDIYWQEGPLQDPERAEEIEDMMCDAGVRTRCND
jgi:TPR repeat protein